MKKLLKHIGIVDIPATTRKFIVRDEFVVGKNDINWIDENVKKWFYNIVEEPIGKTKLSQDVLTESSCDNPIIAKLGGKKKAVTLFSQISCLIKNVLQKDGTVYIFYAETTEFDKDEEHFAYINNKGEKVVLCDVNVRCFGDGWYVFANTVFDPDRWTVGYRFFPRNS